MTTQIKGCPLEVMSAVERPGAAPTDQAKCLNQLARKALHKGKASADEPVQVEAKIIALTRKPAQTKTHFLVS